MKLPKFISNKLESAKQKIIAAVVSLIVVALISVGVSEEIATALGDFLTVLAQALTEGETSP